MTYSSEFDRVHYPLPMSYNGPPDPSRLQQTIRDLHHRLEQTAAEQHGVARGAADELHQLRGDHARVLAESARLHSENDELKLRLAHLASVARPGADNDVGVLRQIIGKLESGGPAECCCGGCSTRVQC